MAKPPSDLMSPPSDLIDGNAPPSDLMSPPSDLVSASKPPKEEPKASVSIGPMLTKAIEPLSKALPTAAEFVYEALPSTETLFGQGTPQEAGLGERLAKVGETGVAGSLIAGGAKALGAPMVAGGTK